MHRIADHTDDVELKALKDYIAQSVELLQQLRNGDLGAAAQTAQLIDSSSANAPRGKLSDPSPARAVLDLCHQTACTVLDSSSAVQEEGEVEDEIEYSAPDDTSKQDSTSEGSNRSPSKSSSCSDTTTHSSSITELQIKEDDKSLSSSYDSLKSSRNDEQFHDQVSCQESRKARVIDINAELHSLLMQIKRTFPIERAKSANLISTRRTPKTNIHQDDNSGYQDEAESIEKELLAEVDLRVKQEMEKLAIVRKHR